MKTLIAVLGLIATAIVPLYGQKAAQGEFPFEIRTIRKETKGMAYVEKAWKNYVPCIEVNIRTSEDLGDRKAFVKAFFYDGEKKLLAKFGEPTLVSNKDEGTSSMPDFLKSGEKYDVYFAIPTRYLSGKEKWETVVVVFGEGKRAVATAFPAGSIADFDFTGKEVAVEGKR